MTRIGSYDKPRTIMPIIAWQDGRPISRLNGCKIHQNVCDLVAWPDGEEECMMCARDRQPGWPEIKKPVSEWMR